MLLPGVGPLKGQPAPLGELVQGHAVTQDVPDDIAVCPQLSPQCRNVLGYLSGGLSDVGRARQLGGIAVKLGEQVPQVLGPNILLQGGHGGLGDLTGHGVFLAVFVVSHTGPAAGDGGGEIRHSCREVLAEDHSGIGVPGIYAVNGLLHGVRHDPVNGGFGG